MEKWQIIEEFGRGGDVQAGNHKKREVESANASPFHRRMQALSIKNNKKKGMREGCVTTHEIGRKPSRGEEEGMSQGNLNGSFMNFFVLFFFATFFLGIFVLRGESEGFGIDEM